jgi:hypothetical protein
MMVKSARNCLRASAWNCPSMSWRSELSAPSAFTVSIPLMASIWCEKYLPKASSRLWKMGRSQWAEKNIRRA